MDESTTTYGVLQAGDLPLGTDIVLKYPLNTSLSYRITMGNAAYALQYGAGMNGRTPEVIQDYFEDMQLKSTLSEKLENNLEKAQQLVEKSDIIALSLDLDGVVFDGYDTEGVPIFNEVELNRIRMHVGRTRQALNQQNKELLVTLNTNREWTIIEPVMQAIDPDATNWNATLEGGHVLAYRDNFLPEEFSTEKGDGYKREYVSRNGKKAQVIKRYDDGSVLAVESLLETHPELNQLRLGDAHMSLSEARTQTVQLFQDWIDQGAFGNNSYMPEGRMGMVTARNVVEEMVKLPGDTEPLKGYVKKYFVPDGSPVVEGIRQVLKLEGDSREWPFDVIYYPDDSGLDIQFKGVDKISGQWQMTERLRSIRGIDENKKIGILHIGDSGTDEVSGRMEELNADAVVVAVANTENQHLRDQSIALTSRPVRRGVAETLLILREMSMGKVTPAAIEAYKDQHSVGDHIKGYLGREEPRKGDIDLRKIMKDVDVSQLADVSQLIEMVKARGGRVFVYGNGGSYDNARLVVNYLSEAGIQAKTPGSTSVIKKAMDGGGFNTVFIEALKRDRFNEKDLVIGISGSGNSPNVLVAHDYAQGVRLKALDSTIKELAQMGITINTDLLVTKTLSKDPTNTEAIAAAIAAFESSVVAAWDQAKNNEPAQKLLRVIAESQNVMSLGGRDGGIMRQLTGSTFTVLAKTDCMEALEDHNPMVMRAVAARIMGKSIDTALKEATEPLDTLRQPEVLKGLITFATTMEKTIFNGGRVIIVGNQHKHPSVTHAEADWGRGMINMLPISGPNVIIVERNLNALMATSNDDGPRFRYADQLGEMNLKQNDVVVFIGDSKDEPAFEIALDEAQESGAQTYIIGHDIAANKADLPANDQQVDVAATAVVHHISRAINDHMRARDGVGWEVQPLVGIPKDIAAYITEKMGEERKLSKKETLVLEDMLREQKLLKDGKVITWCYGRPYVADSAEKFGLPRGFY